MLLIFKAFSSLLLGENTATNRPFPCLSVGEDVADERLLDPVLRPNKALPFLVAKHAVMSLHSRHKHLATFQHLDGWRP